MTGSGESFVDCDLDGGEFGIWHTDEMEELQRAIY